MPAISTSRLWQRPRGGGDEFTEFQLERVDQLPVALGGGAELIVPKLSDEPLEMRHHRLGAGRPRLGLLSRQALGRERRLQGGDFARSDVRLGRHRAARFRLVVAPRL